MHPYPNSFVPKGPVEMSDQLLTIYASLYSNSNSNKNS